MANKLFRDYFNEKVISTALPALAKLLIQDGSGEPTQINAASISTGQLVKITENGKTGLRLKDVNPANYGNIGTEAVDLSISQSASNTKGATGDYSHASGLNTGASGFASHAEGNGTTASGAESHAEGNETIAIGQASHAEGISTKASGYASHAEGSNAVASGGSSHAQGTQTFSRSFGEHSGGVNGTDYTPQSVTGFDLTDRLVNYGNGVDTSNRSDAYTLFKNGMQKFFTAALNTITNAVKGSVMLDENARLNIHDGTAFKAVAFSSEVDAKISGSGTTNFLPKFTASGAVGNSQLFDNGTSIGFGTTTPTASLEMVNKSFKLSNTFSGSNIVMGTVFAIMEISGFSNAATRTIKITTSGSSFFNGGNVAFGKEIPTERLDVVGNGKFSGTVTAGSDISANGVTVGRGGGNVATNTAIGSGALLNNSTGVNNHASGKDSLRNNTTGNNNTANGVNALLNNSTGVSNHASGVNSLFNNTTGNNNTANGVSAGRFIGDGSNATIVNNSVFFGFETKPLGNSETNQIVIGHTAIGAGSNTVTLGNTAITNTILRGAVSFAQFTTATEPAYLKGAQFFNTTLDKMRIGGATAYETVTSS